MFSPITINTFSKLSRMFISKNLNHQSAVRNSRKCSSLIRSWYPIHEQSIFSTDLISRYQHSTFIRACTNLHSVLDLQKRYKSKNPRKRPEYDSDSDEEEEDDEEGLTKATKPMKVRVQSLRLDGLLKKSLGVARNKIETHFYAGDIRINGKKPSKKSYQVKVGDEVDLIKGVSPLNPDFLSISRVEVLSVEEDREEEEEQLIVKIRRTKTMYVENYETDPWKKSLSAE